MHLTEKAALVCRIAHNAVGQTRKYTHIPYWHHPAAVARTVQGIPDVVPEMVAAAFLHDTVEDTHLTLDDIAREFGPVVGTLVYELTDQYADPSLGNRAKRKTMECERLAYISSAAQTIKYADLIDNTTSIVEYDPGFARVYLKEKRQILEVMTAGDPILRERAFEMLEDAERTLAQTLERNRANTYRVYINGHETATVFSEEKAWQVIGRQPFGSRHTVCDADGNTRPEFVPY